MSDAVPMEPTSLYYASFLSEDEPVRELLLQHGYIVITELPVELLESISVAETEALKYFQNPDKTKTIINKDTSQFSGYCVRKIWGGILEREHYHLLCGQTANALWTSESMKDAFIMLAKNLESIAYRALSVTKVVIPALVGEPFHSSDQSVFDVFLYGNESERKENMCSHTDPGLFTVKPLSTVEGLEIFDQSCNCWISLEPATSSPAIVVFGCDMLRELSNDKYNAVSHKVLTSTKPRLSLVYELRCDGC